jgi:hypothetical protein
VPQRKSDRRATSESPRGSRKGAKKQPPKRRARDGSTTVTITPAAAGVIYDGDSLDDWDDEELLRGRRRNKNGRFVGRPPTVIPAALHKELTRRRYSKAHDLLADSLVDAALMLRSIINDELADAADRIKAAEVMFNRVVGRPREQVSLAIQTEGPAPWERLVSAAIVPNAETALRLMQGAVIDGEVVDEEDDPDE